MLRLALASILFAAVPMLSCNPYDPELPPAPYCCGGSEMEGFICPDGYRAVIRPSNETGCNAPHCQCELATGPGPGSDGGDPGPFSCADDSKREPNNNITVATPTVINGTASASNEQVFNPMAICPATDVDIYKMVVPTASPAEPTAVEVVVDFEEIAREVEVDILNSGGQSIAMGSPAGSGRMRAFTNATVTGDYFAQVKSGNDTENNYRIVMMITPTAP